MQGYRKIADLPEVRFWETGPNITIAEDTVINEFGRIGYLLESVKHLQNSLELLNENGLIGSAAIRSSLPHELTLEISRQANISIGKPLVGKFKLFNEIYAFHTSVLSSDSESKVSVERPKKIFRIQNRNLDRTYLEDNDQFPVTLKEVNGRRLGRGSVLDLSPLGMAVSFEQSDTFPESRLKNFDQNLLIYAEIPSLNDVAPFIAQVKHFRRHKNRSIIGLSSTIPIALGQNDSLEDFLLGRRYSNVVRAKGDNEYSRIWKMMEKLENVVHVDYSRRESSIITWKKASWSPIPLHRIYLLHDDNHPEETTGTLSVSRFYKSTWLIHQLATDGARARVLSQQLYGRVLDFLRQTQDARFTVGTWPSASRAFDRYYLDFIQNDPDQSLHYLEKTLILEYPTVQAELELQKKKTDNQIIIRPFIYHDQGAILSFLRRKYPPIFLQALDLSEYQMLFEDVSNYYSRVGLQRQRDILIALKGSHMIGFAIIEYGSPNQNIFSLFDNFRLFSMTDDPKLSSNLKTRLMHSIMRKYSERGIDRALSWTNDSELETCVSCSERTLDAYFWIANAKRMKAFMRHLDRLHGSLQLRRAMKYSKKLNSNI